MSRHHETKSPAHPRLSSSLASSAAVSIRMLSIICTNEVDFGRLLRDVAIALASIVSALTKASYASFSAEACGVLLDLGTFLPADVPLRVRLRNGVPGRLALMTIDRVEFRCTGFFRPLSCKSFLTR